MRPVSTTRSPSVISGLSSSTTNHWRASVQVPPGRFIVSHGAAWRAYHDHGTPGAPAEARAARPPAVRACTKSAGAGGATYRIALKGLQVDAAASRAGVPVGAASCSIRRISSRCSSSRATWWGETSIASMLMPPWGGMLNWYRTRAGTVRPDSMVVPPGCGRAPPRSAGAGSQ